MTAFPTVRVAAVQATPVLLDVDATTDKAVGLIGDAAEAGARLVVMPECFLSAYPSSAWAASAARFDGADGLWNACGAPRSTSAVLTSDAWSTPAGATTSTS